MWRSTWFRLAVLAAALGVAAAAWMFRTTTDVQVSTASVTDGQIRRHILATGTVQAVSTVEVGVQVSGMVESLAADFNSLVKAGQIVAKLDPSSYDAQLREAEAARLQAEAARRRADADVLGFKTAVEDARMKLTRAEGLSLLMPRSDLDAARVAMDEANADLASGQAAVVEAAAAVDQAKAAVDQATVNLAHTIIRSPVDGIVIERSVDVGQTLAASVQSPVLFRIAANLERLQVQVDIDESDVGGVSTGDVATFQVDAYPGETFSGTISQVRNQPVAQQTATATAVGAPATSATSTIATVVSYTTIVDVANADERLRPGMTAQVVLPGTRREHVIRIPNGALAFRPPAEVLQAIGEVEPRPAAGAGENDRALRSVWEYDGRRFTPIAVRAGVADEGWTELVSGSIRPGDALVTSAVLQRRRGL